MRQKIMPQQITLFEDGENGQIKRVGGGVKGRFGKIQLTHSFEEIISLENLCLAWQEFLVGKKSKPDIQLFSFHLMDNIISLHEELANKTYRHGDYISFHITDPKPRHIHKASVRDRLLHHALHRVLYPFFDRIFIPDSYSCRVNKGLHKAINRFRQMTLQASQNNTKTCWILKCDIRKFFASIDHEILLSILDEYIPDKDIMELLMEIVGSFHTPTPICHPRENEDTAIGRLDSPRMLRGGNDNCGVGLPLGNLTSQLFANIYLNHFDQWVKHHLKAKCYIRYADDFVFLSRDKKWLERITSDIQHFLQVNLRLSLHPHKIFLKTIASGIDFLGWVNFPRHRVLRRTTRQRMFARVKENSSIETLQSYLGLLSHGHTFEIRQKLLEWRWVWGYRTCS